MKRLPDDLLAIVLFALSFVFCQTAFALHPKHPKKQRYCWINVATGKPASDVLPPGTRRLSPTEAIGESGSEWFFTPNGTWINVATGKPASDILPPGTRRLSPTEAIGKSGSEWVYVPCPEQSAAETAPPTKKEQPKIPNQTGIFFRTGEVQLLAYGIGGTGQGVRNVDEPGTGTAATTRTTFVDNPNGPGSIAVTTAVPATAARSRNAAPLQGGFGGAGIEAKYFVTQNIGLGVEGDWIGGDSSIGTVMATVTARFPKGSNAPYLFVGGGVQFDGRTQAVGKLGGGIEHRFSPHSGIFADGAWMFSEHENAAVFRLGVSMAFGPGDPPASPSYKK